MIIDQYVMLALYFVLIRWQIFATAYNIVVQVTIFIIEHKKSIYRQKPPAVRRHMCERKIVFIVIGRAECLCIQLTLTGGYYVGAFGRRICLFPFLVLKRRERDDRPFDVSDAPRARLQECERVKVNERKSMNHPGKKNCTQLFINRTLSRINHKYL